MQYAVRGLKHVSPAKSAVTFTIIFVLARSVLFLEIVDGHGQRSTHQ